MKAFPPPVRQLPLALDRVRPTALLPMSIPTAIDAELIDVLATLLLEAANVKAANVVRGMTGGANEVEN